jgi:hypothetical protein
VQQTENNNVTTAGTMCEVETSPFVKYGDRGDSSHCTGTMCKVEIPPFLKSGDRSDRQLSRYRYNVQGGNSAFFEVWRSWRPSAVTVRESHIVAKCCVL